MSNHASKREHRFSLSAAKPPHKSPNSRRTSVACSKSLEQNRKLHAEMVSYLEIACFGPVSAQTALCRTPSVDRIELCAGPASGGGTTPSLPDFKTIKSEPNLRNIPVNIMIRPRAEQSFTATREDFEGMKASIEEFKVVGASGFVFGILDNEGRVDEERCKELVRLAGQRPCTFHRAFDRTRDLEEALEAVIKVGFATVLTSGGAGSVEEGAERIRRLMEQARGRIVVMPGGGVRAGNVRGLMERLGEGVEWWHSSAVLDEGAGADAGEIERLRSAMGS